MPIAAKPLPNPYPKIELPENIQSYVRQNHGETAEWKYSERRCPTDKTKLISIAVSRENGTRRKFVEEELYCPTCGAPYSPNATPEQLRREAREYLKEDIPRALAEERRKVAALEEILRIGKAEGLIE
jgi:uncharacterized protein YbaR (Trm112 family)